MGCTEGGVCRSINDDADDNKSEITDMEFLDEKKVGDKKGPTEPTLQESEKGEVTDMKFIPARYGKERKEQPQSEEKNTKELLTEDEKMLSEIKDKDMKAVEGSFATNVWDSGLV